MPKRKKPSPAYASDKFDTAYFEHLLQCRMLAGTGLYRCIRMMAVNHAILDRHPDYTGEYDMFHAAKCNFFMDWEGDTIHRIQNHLRHWLGRYPLFNPRTLFTLMKHFIRKPPTRMDEARFMRIQRNENSFLWDRSQTLEDIEYARVKEGLLLEEIALEEVRCEKTIEILEDFMCKDVAQMVMDYTK